jgi:hypothetical protein
MTWTPRRSTIFLLWYGEKMLAGDAPTEAEQELFIEARKASIAAAKTILRVKDEDFAYTPGEPCPGLNR